MPASDDDVVFLSLSLTKKGMPFFNKQTCVLIEILLLQQLLIGL